MKNRRILYLMTCFIFLSSMQTGFAAEKNKSQPQINTHAFIYTYDEMLDFDLENYFAEHYPDLMEYTDTLTYWGGRSTVSPHILVTLIVMQNSINGAYNGIDPDAPFTSLSDKKGFAEQTEDVSAFLSKEYYDAKESGSEVSADIAIEALLSRKDQKDHAARAATRAISDTKLQDFSTQLNQLFPKFSITPKKLKINQGAAGDQGATPPTLQLPYPIGEGWYFGGTHSRESAIDFYKDLLSWGDNTSDKLVSAAHAGRVFVESPCSVEIVADDGLWSTSYYHLDNIQVVTGQRVSANDFIANYANNVEQALCQGGSSTGPHVHFYLKKSGELNSLDGVSLSGYKVHAGEYDYDVERNHFWLSADGTRYFGFDRRFDNQRLYNYGATSQVDDNDPNDSNNPSPSGLVDACQQGKTPVENVRLSAGAPVCLQGTDWQRQMSFFVEDEYVGKSMKIVMGHGSGNGNLQHRYGDRPTRSEYDHMSSNSDNNESIVVNNLSRGWHYIHVRAADNSSFSGVTLLVTYDVNTTYSNDSTGPEDSVMIVSATGKCLDAKSGSSSEVVTWSCHGRDNQRWKMMGREIKGTNGRCLDAKNTAVMLSQCNNSASQQWRAENGLIKSSAGKCLDIEGGSTANGASVITWSCHGRENQQWVTRQ